MFVHTFLLISFQMNSFSISQDQLDAAIKAALSVVHTSTVSTTVAVVPEPKEEKKQTRCPMCRHKLMLSDMACRCGIRHCSKHRLPEEHACEFNHKQNEKTLLEKTLVKCVADKLERC